MQFQVRNMSGSSYVVYELHIRLDADAWKVFRRFRWALPLVVPFGFLGLSLRVAHMRIFLFV